MKYTKNGHKASPLYVKRNLAWADELEANPLKTTQDMENFDTRGRCCLCVASDLAAKRKKIHRSALRFGGLPSNEAIAFFGWSGSDPMLVSDNAVTWNDTYDTNHKVIAQLVREEYAEENLVEGPNP